MRAGVVAWFLPIIVIGAPVIILLPVGEPLVWLPKIIASFVMVLLLQIALVGYYLKDVGVLWRIFAGIGAMVLVAYIAAGSLMLLGGGMVAIILLTIEQVIAKKRLGLRHYSGGGTKIFKPVCLVVTIAADRNLERR